MISRCHFLLFSILMLCTQPLRAIEWWPTPYELELEWSEDISGTFQAFTAFEPVPGGEQYVLVARPDFDGPYGRYKSAYVVYDAEHRNLQQLNFVATVTHASGLDIDGDGINELLISYLEDSLAGIRAFEWPSFKVLWEFALRERDFRWRGNEHWDIFLEARATFEIPSLAKSSVLVMVREGYAGMPSGLVMLNALDGTELWHYWIASGMDGDAEFQIYRPADMPAQVIVGTSACSNGAQYNGTQDDHSYVFSIDTRGELRWLHKYTIQFSAFMPLLTTHRGRDALVTMRSVSSPGGRDQILIMDPNTGVVSDSMGIVEKGTFHRIQRWNPGRDGQERFLITCPDGKPLVCDAELQLETVLNAPAGRVYPIDLDNNRILEALSNPPDGRFEVRDMNFGLLAKVSDKCGANLTLRRPAPEYAYICGSHDNHIRVFSLHKTKYYMLAIAGRIAGAGVLAILVGFTPFWAIRARIAYIRARREREQTRAWAALASKLAHDIRTPITVLQLSGHNLERELQAAYDNVPDHIEKYFDVIRREAIRTENAAKNMLKFARVEKPVLEPTQLCELVKNTVESYPHSSDLEITFDIEPELPVSWVDRQQVVNLVENLMSNSVKAMKGKGSLTVRLQRAQGLPVKVTEGAVELEFEDTGCGISKQDLPRIFDPYFSHSQGGTGLGLVIVKKIVEDHHGTIQVSSEVGSGTKVKIRLPITPGGTHAQ